MESSASGFPADWHEEYEQNGGGEFYAPGDATGTLRLNILTMEAPPGKPFGLSTPADVLEDESLKYSAPVTPLRENVAMIQYDLPAEEGGRQLSIRHWRVAQALPPRHIRLILFSYTLFAEQLEHRGSQAELELIEREIRGAELASVLGEIPKVKKPWWRPW